MKNSNQIIGILLPGTFYKLGNEGKKSYAKFEVKTKRGIKSCTAFSHLADLITSLSDGTELAISGSERTSAGGDSNFVVYELSDLSPEPIVSTPISNYWESERGKADQAEIIKYQERHGLVRCHVPCGGRLVSKYYPREETTQEAPHQGRNGNVEGNPGQQGNEATGTDPDTQRGTRGNNYPRLEFIMDTFGAKEISDWMQSQIQDGKLNNKNYKPTLEMLFEKAKSISTKGGFAPT